jgi:tetratricopeptide (TPR) repeat protein
MNNPDNSKHPRVFISYSHDSIEHIDRVLALSNRLRQDGIDCILDQYESSPPEGWTRWMDRNIRDADFVLMVCTETYYRRVMLDEEPGTGLGVKWEGKLIYQHIYNADSCNIRFIPILFEYCHVQHIPTPLQDATRYRVDTQVGYDALYARLIKQILVEKPELGKLRKLQSRQRHPDFPFKISLAKLPTTGSLLLGRENELKLLDDTWKTDNINILSLVAWGGVGKTALVNFWLCHRMALDNYRGAQRVFGWSFYSQGTREDRQASADEFLVKALEWFGDPKMAQSDRSPWDKGLRLAELVQKYKTLLILDGVEPLQYPPGPMEGRLRDQGLLALLKQLAASNPGLCIITTRKKIADLAYAEGSTVKSIDLEDLPEPAAIELLKSYSLKGTDKELREAARQFGCHALALNLLGTYLSKVHDGEIRNRDKIPQLIDDRQQQGIHARKVMVGYEIYLKGTPELNILYILGLFDRPAEAGAIEVLRKEPPINGLSSKLVKLSDSDYKLSLSNLRELKLISPEDKDRPGALDCHPLVREYFGQRLKETNPAAWRQAHTRLYEYYKNLPKKKYPDTLEEMQPLFAAVAHGCQAGLHQKALDDVYWDRIQRRNEYYSTRKLGAFGLDLSALAGFFDVLWTKPVPTLNEPDKALVLSWAGFDLRALGRLQETAQPMQTSLWAYEKGEKWECSAIDANNLSELYLTLGEIKEAINFAEKSVEYSDKSGDLFEKFSNRTTLADALHQAGKLKDAEELFLEAEIMQKDYQPEYPCLYSLGSFRFCDLLLTKGQYSDAQKRAGVALEIVLHGSRNLLDIALNKLTLGCSVILQAENEKTGNFSKAIEFLNQAVDGLRNAGAQEFIVRGLLAQASLYRLQGDFHSAWSDLTEAKEIAERGEMKLYLADYHLEAARLHLAEGGKYADASDHYEKAKALIDQTGYHRRDAELAALKSHLDRQSP